jgi:hypothetical protein
MAGMLGLGWEGDRFLMSADIANIGAIFAAALIRNDHINTHDVMAHGANPWEWREHYWANARILSASFDI